MYVHINFFLGFFSNLERVVSGALGLQRGSERRQCLMPNEAGDRCTSAYKQTEVVSYWLEQRESGGLTVVLVPQAMELRKAATP